MSDPPIPVLINAGGGAAARAGAALIDQVTAAFADAGLAVTVELLEGAAVRERVQELAERRLVVVGGGDGTLGCAAGALAGRDTALGILPLGTRNHLARELGIPLDLPGAAKLIAAGRRRAIDLGRCNDRVFVNNASIGVYPALVRNRDATRDRRGWPKWVAIMPATWAALRRLRHHRLRLSFGDDRAEVVTPLLFVGNNRYLLERGQVGSRAALDDGCLSVFAIASRRRWALVTMVVRMLAGAADRDSDFAAIGETATLAVGGRSRDVDVALDGEVVRLPMPLRFTVMPRALTVIGAG